jgi:hypothetical protein
MSILCVFIYVERIFELKTATRKTTLASRKIGAFIAMQTVD